MANTPNTKPMYVRAIPKTRTALKKLIAELSERDRRINQEVFVTASWLWLQQLEADTIYKGIEPFVGEIKEQLDAEKKAKKAPSGEPPMKITGGEPRGKKTKRG